MRKDVRHAKAAMMSASEPRMSKAQPMEERARKEVRMRVVSLVGCAPERTERADLRSWGGC